MEDQQSTSMILNKLEIQKGILNEKQKPDALTFGRVQSGKFKLRTLW